MDNNINRLQQYMQLFRQANAMPKQYIDTGGGVGPVPVETPYYRTGPDSLNWAAQQVGNEDQATQRQAPPDFFSGGGGGGRPSVPPAYVSPSMPDASNPFAARAQQLNNDPYSGQGGQSEIQNYLRRLMGGGANGPGTRSYSATVGIRG